MGTKHLYRREDSKGTYYLRFKHRGRQHRVSLKTDDLETAKRRLPIVMERLKNPEREIFLYAICAGKEQVKVGISDDPYKRRSGVANGNAQEVSLAAQSRISKSRQAARWAEAQWHSRLVNYQASGEWFIGPPRVIEAIVSMVAKGGIPHQRKIDQAMRIYCRREALKVTF
jgi:hypothetical protein